MPDIAITRIYRCHYIPRTANGEPLWSPEGDYPYTQVRAPSATAAKVLASTATGCQVVEVLRLETEEEALPCEEVTP